MKQDDLETKKLIDGLTSCLSKAGCPLSDQQVILIIGYLFSWAHGREMSVTLITEDSPPPWIPRH